MSSKRQTLLKPDPARVIELPSAISSLAFPGATMADSGFEQDRSRREQELEALRAIYGDELEIVSTREVRVRLSPVEARERLAVLELHLPDDYPSRSAPTPLLDAPTPPGMVEEITLELLQMFEQAEVIYLWIEHLRERLRNYFEDDEAGGQRDAVLHSSLLADAVEEAEADAVIAASNEFTFQPSTSHFGQRVRHFDAASASPENEVGLVHGEPVTPPGKSTFQAHFARVSTANQVQWAIRRLLEDRKVARATHNIIAYRYFDAQRGVQVSDNDDDGENAAGGRLAALLELMDANNVLIIVSRWYGGIHLGPDRFKYISNCARALLESQGHGNFNDKRSSGLKKKR